MLVLTFANTKHAFPVILFLDKSKCLRELLAPLPKIPGRGGKRGKGRERGGGKEGEERVRERREGEGGKGREGREK